MNDKLLFLTPTDDATFSRVTGLQISLNLELVEHKRARLFPLYSELYYLAESDFFSFHAIQMQKMFNFEIDPRNDVATQCPITRVAPWLYQCGFG